MKVKEVQVKTLIKTITKRDVLFHGKYTIDPYQNCEFGCIYCDSTLDDTIYVKTNALDLLNNELSQLSLGRIIIGSVHDPYQPVEQKFHLTHKIISQLSQTKFPVHILTKSPTILKDISIIKTMVRPIVTFTILGMKETFWKTIEPNAPSPTKRLQAMKSLSEQGITTGIALIPTFPLLTDNLVQDLVKKAKEYHASYFLYRPLFLQGKQKEIFFKCIKKSYPTIYLEYQQLYHNRQTPPSNYINTLNNSISNICKNLNLSTVIPE
jgi:DNA repair photolyase